MNYKLFPIICIVTLLIVAASCASIGNPSGGPRDEDPPRFVGSNPPPGSTNVKKDRIELQFSEIVNVKDAFTNVIVSPPSNQRPRVSSSGRKVYVDFTDTLADNTTYTIDFGNSIEDNNESNKLPSFRYSFSTGPDIDTLEISGVVLSSDNLEPQQGILVGAYSNLSDTAYKTLPFERVSKTDDRGRFSILGLKPGEYRVFALNDLDNDFYRANPEEAMGFYEVTVSPTTERVMTTDTVFNLKNGEVDTILSRERTRFLPNDILIRTFESKYKSQYLQNYQRVDSTRLSFIFNSPTDSLPKISVVGKPDLKDWYVLERSQNNDTLTYWIKDSEIIGTDSLTIAAEYLRTDSAQNLTAFADTLKFFYSRELKNALAEKAKAKEKEQKEKEKEKKKKEKELENGEAEEATDTIEEVEKPLPLQLKMITSNTHEVYLPVYMEFETPLAKLDTASFKLEVEIDSVWQPVPKPWKAEPADSVNPRKLKVEYPWEFETQYRLSLDSVAAVGIYGLVNEPLDFKFKTKSQDEYSSIVFDITNFVDTVPAFMEIVNTSDTPVKRVKVENGKAVFQFLEPGKYYARIYEDFNGNGIYDTGDFDTNTLPDMAYYYPKIINLKKNWERSESWNVFETAVDLMKPFELRKNKSEEEKKAQSNKSNEEEGEGDDEDEYFDPTRNPFDPNDRGRNNQR